MKTYLIPSLKLTVLLIVVCSLLYPLLVAGIAKAAPGGGKGETVLLNGKVVGYANIGQLFVRDDHFQGRPSAVQYNAAGSGGSNKAASNPEYIVTVKARIDTFRVHNPDIPVSSIPSELVTASGSGLDPDLSPAAAHVQVPRIARLRHRSEAELHALVDSLTETPLFGPEKVNVLKLNVKLEILNSKPLNSNY